MRECYNIMYRLGMSTFNMNMNEEDFLLTDSI